MKRDRSSFCLYSDGKFYGASQQGCVAQSFFWGYWLRAGDTVHLSYGTSNIFCFEVVESTGTKNAFQVVRVVDCYNQPVRFQHMRTDTGWTSLYNRGFLRISKGQSLVYATPDFEIKPGGWDKVKSSADTLTYKWRCNREVLESINGGTLYVDTVAGNGSVVLKGKEVRWL